jgi:hypothetical protein
MLFLGPNIKIEKEIFFPIFPIFFHILKYMEKRIINERQMADEKTTLKIRRSIFFILSPLLLVYSFYYMILIERNTYGSLIFMNSFVQPPLYVLFYEAYDRKDKWKLLKIILIMNLIIFVGVAISIYEMSLR